MGCLFGVQPLIDILPQLLQWCLLYHAILDRVITALDCISYILAVSMAISISCRVIVSLFVSFIEDAMIIIHTKPTRYLPYFKALLRKHVALKALGWNSFILYYPQGIIHIFQQYPFLSSKTSFGPRVLSLPASVCECVCVCVSITSLSARSG